MYNTNPNTNYNPWSRNLKKELINKKFLQTDDHTVDVVSQVESCTLGYHHEELLYWLALLPARTPTDTLTPPPVAPPRHQSSLR